MPQPRPAIKAPRPSPIFSQTPFGALSRLSDKRVMREGTTGKEVAVLPGHEHAVRTVAFSPDGSYIATTFEDRIARIWNTATGKEVAVLRGHDEDVQAITFSPDGKRVVTASRDKTARIWDAATGMEVTALRGHDDGVISAAFSPDGSRIVTESSDQTTRIWDTATGMQLAVSSGSGRSTTFSLASLRFLRTRLREFGMPRPAKRWPSRSCAAKMMMLLRCYVPRPQRASGSGT
jgi:WD40 repeat protein